MAADADGDFVVAWQSNSSPGTDLSSTSVQGQRYASGGTPLGAQFQVNTYTPSFQDDPFIVANVDGDFVVTWQSYGSPGTDASNESIQGQRYASNGSAVGTQFQVNTYTTSSQVDSSVAVDVDGDFVVVWYSIGSSGTDTSDHSIQGQRYDSDGSTQGAQFQVNTYTTLQQQFPSVAADAAGGLVVVWDSVGSSGTDTSVRSIQGQRYASSGSALGAQFQIDSFTTSNQFLPSVAADADGDFIVT